MWPKHAATKCKICTTMEQIFSKLERQARDSSLWDYYTLMTETTKGGGISIVDVFPYLVILPGPDFENKTYDKKWFIWIFVPKIIRNALQLFR